MAFGLTSEGFIPKTLDVIRSEIEAALRAVFGASIKLGNKSIFGQIVAIIAERLAELWELAESIAASQDPDKALRSALENICALTGTLRRGATFSAVTLTLTGAPATLVDPGKRVATKSTAQEFATDAAATITSVGAWAPSTAYALDARVTNASRVYQCTDAGVSAGSGGPTTDEEEITDGGVEWIYVGEGTGAVDVLAHAILSGPVVAVAGDLTEIVNEVTGWESVTNLLDANEGKAVMNDHDLRLLRELELALGGSTPPDALRAELLGVPGVEAVTIFYNNTDTTNGDGLPPHSVEALVRGPESPTADFDQAIFDKLLAGVAAGIKTFSTGGGAVNGTALDEVGTAHNMAFTRPTNVPIYVAVTLVKDPSEYPADGDEQVKLAIVEYGDAQNTGKNVVSSRITAAVFDVLGVLDVTACLISTLPGPVSSTTIPISLRELAIYDTSRISVTTSNGVP